MSNGVRWAIVLAPSFPIKPRGYRSHSISLNQTAERIPELVVRANTQFDGGRQETRNALLRQAFPDAGTGVLSPLPTDSNLERRKDRFSL